MRYRKILTPLFVFFFSILNARTISGQILSSSDSIPLKGLSCSLGPDSLSTNQTITDSLGNFILSASDHKYFKLEISSPDIFPLYIDISPGNKDIPLKEIYVDKVTTLDELSVSADYIIHSRGRVISYPSETDIETSSSSIELLQKMPFDGLSVNPISRNIEVEGGTPVILINGIPSSIEALRNIQIQDILKIEYSRFTPAKYADSKKTGLLSIFLKERPDGGFFSFWGRSALNTKFLDASLSGKYVYKNSQFSILYTPSWRNYNKVYTTSLQDYISDDITVSLHEKSSAPFYYISNNLELKYDLSYKPGNLLSVSFSMEPFKDQRRQFGDSFDSILGSYSMNNSNHQNSINPSLDLFYHHEFSPSDALEVEVTGTIRSQKIVSLSKYEYPTFQNEYLLNTTSKRNSLISEISYSHSMPFDATLNTGFQNTVSYNRNHYHTTDYKPFLSENNNFLYVSYEQSLNNVWYMIYTGAKMFWTKNDMTKRHFVKNISSVSASWKINTKWNMKASCSYSPNIPSLSQLTNYPQQISPYLFSDGNPNLKTTTESSIKLTGSYSHSLFSIDLTALGILYNHPIYASTKPSTAERFLISPDNFKKASLVAGDINFNLNTFHGFGANLQCMLAYYKTSDIMWKHSLTSFSADINVWWNHGPFTITYWRKFPGKYLNGQTIENDENGDLLSFTYKTTKNLSIELSWWYMFEKKGTRYISKELSSISPGHQFTYIKNNSNMIVLTLNYTIDFGRKLDTTKRTLKNKDTESAIYKL